MSIQPNYIDNSLTLTTANFAYYVYLYVDDDTTLKLSQNFFDLSPGWPMTVKITSSHSLFQIISLLNIRTIFDTFAAVTKDQQ